MKQILIVFIAGVILSACGGGGASKSGLGDNGSRGFTAERGGITGSTSGGMSRRFERNQLASGLDRIGFSGNGQSIGVLESSTVYGRNNQYANRVEYGLKVSGGYYKAVRPNRAPVFQSSRADHADMVTTIAIGRTNGIAYRAKVVDYDYEFSRGRDARASHIELGEIYADAKNRNLDAINNSWRTWLHAKYTRAKNGYDYRTVRRIQASKISLGVDAQGNGIYDDSISYIFNNRCNTYKTYLNNAKKGLRVYTNYGFQNHAVSQQELQSVYDISCKGGYSDYGTRAVYEDYIGKDFIRQIEADKDNDRDAPIWVWAAGNDNEENGSLLATMPAVIPKAEDYWLSVVATSYKQGQYRHSNYSAKCGKARKYCLTAVVDGSRYIDYKGGYINNGGTSAAAPNVTAGLALIKQAFPSKDSRWARKRLLATASHKTADGRYLRDKNGNIVYPDADGYSAIFGRGIMRLDLALQPIGTSSIPVSGTTLSSASKYHMQDSFVQSSVAFGDGIKNGLATVHTKKFDSMGAEFDTTLGDRAYIKPVDKGSQFFNFDGKNASYTPFVKPIGQSNLSFLDTKSYTFKHFAYAENMMPYTPQYKDPKKQPLQLSYAMGGDQAIQISIPTHTQDKRTSSTTLQFVYGTLQPTKPHNMVQSFGLYTEQGTVLSSRFNGAYGGVGRTNTAYWNSTYHTQWGKWKVRYNSLSGISNSNSVGGRSIQSISALLTSAFSLMGNRTYRTGELGLAIYQPLRVEKGSMNVSYVSGITDNTHLSYDTKTLNIAPSGRQVTVEAYYDFAHNPFTVKTQFTKDKSHVKGKDDATVMVRYFKPFK